MSPLAGVMLLAFLLVIVLALLAWALLLPRPRPQERQEVEPLPRREPTFSNDDVRGAKAGTRRPPAPDDAFERFLRAGQPDDSKVREP